MCYNRIPMLTPPALDPETIAACLREHYAVHLVATTFLPLGADAHTYVFRVDTAGGEPYFLKLRDGNFDEIAVAVPAFLRAQGIRRAMAPLATSDDRLALRAHGFDWMLYPFMEGRNGWQTPLSQAKWVALGETMRAIHGSSPAPVLRQRVPHETYDARFRDGVRLFDQDVERRVYDDPTARHFVDFWIARRGQIHTVVDRAHELAHELQEHPRDLVLCHTDLHAGNILIGAAGDFAIVDWDEPRMAPRERDLMFVGGGFFGDSDPDEEAARFYSGYGPVEIDRHVLAYYRYERIVMDFYAYAHEVLDLERSAADRAEGLRQFTGQFLPGEVIEFAHRTYQELA